MGLWAGPDILLPLLLPAQASDEQVIGVFPTAIRRKVVRHLYATALSACHLYRGTSPMFLDAVMAASRVELFMPNV